MTEKVVTFPQDATRPPERRRLSCSHMRRAAATFEAVGFDVIPAPTMLFSAPEASAYSLIPSANGLNASATAFYEVLALAWYRLAYF